MKRRILYVTLYEGLAIVLCTLVFQAASELDAGRAGLVALASSTVAVTWNYLYNALFEHFERRYSGGGRGLRLRLGHTLGMEGGMVLFCVPLFAYGLQLPLAESLALQTGLLGFFLIYNFVFTLGFDRLFGLPASAVRTTP